VQHHGDGEYDDRFPEDDADKEPGHRDELVEEGRSRVDERRAAQREQWRMGVYAPAGSTEPVGRAAERVLGLETDGRPVSERRGRYASLDEFGDGSRDGDGRDAGDGGAP
jgi:hypothetical protein